MSKISTVDVVINQVKAWILNNTYKAGDKLPSEGEICAICDVSRGSVREAMKVLSTIGIVNIRRGDGTYIAENDLPASSINPLHLTLQKSYYSSSELVELREYLEKDIVELIIKNASNEEIDELITYNESLLQAVNSKQKYDVQVTLDMEFHKKMGALTHNILIAIIYARVLDFISEELIRMYGQSTEMGLLSVRMHENIYKALRNRDLEKAKFEIHIAMQNHVKDLAVALSEYEKAELEYEQKYKEAR